MNAIWRASTYSSSVGDNMCVEVSALPGGVGLRDSKNPAQGHLTLGRIRFAALLDGIRGT